MIFRFFSNTISQASRTFAAGSMIVGMMLIGFGFMIFLLPEFFATLAAMLFFAAGIGSAVTGLKILWQQSRIDKMNRQQQGDYRENVRIHKNEDIF
ncbi:MAG TPA: hypothetical protein PLP05_04390 [Sedimentisphaerales bacterium]|nr:hypothetical protein [Sedimentisphaerales bacterium]